MYVDYDTYAGMSPLRRSQTRLSPENTAELVKTHWQRFLEGNRERLNAEQIAFIEQSIAHVRPELYREDRVRTEAEYRGNREKEEQLLRLFPREDIIKLHMEVFRNSGEIRNPLARALVRARFDKSDELDAAFLDMSTLPVDELRQRRPNLPDVLSEYIDVPEEFWALVDDEDARLAALRARAFTHTIRNPLALILWNAIPREAGDDLAHALRELRDGHLRTDLPELLARHYDGVASGEEFWRLAADEDVRMAASKAYVLVSQPWLREEMLRRQR